MQKGVNENKKRLLEFTKERNNNVFVDMILVDKNESYKYSEAYVPVILNENNNNNSNKIYLENIFLNVEYSKLREIEEYTFQGWINIDGDTYPISVNLEMDKEYEKKLYEFYKSFNLNGIEWRTINLSLIKRMYKIVLYEYDFEMTKEILKGIEEKKYNIQYDFNEYEHSFLRNKMLLWNVEEKKLLSSMFVRPTENNVFFEYSLNMSEDKKVLIKNNERNSILFSYVDEKKKIKIISNNSKEEIWEIYLIKDRILCERVLEMCNFLMNDSNFRFNNYRDESFIEKLMEKYSIEKIFRNKGSLEREFLSYQNIKDEMNLWDINIGKKIDENIELYNPNYFINSGFDRLKDMKRERLNIYVKKLKDEKYFQDNFSFIIGEIQRKYFEYEVVGHIYE